MKLIQKLLIANRGEIAVRIIRACRELNIRTVAVYSTVDKESLHVMLADEAVCIGDHRLSSSYLNQEAILQAAVNTQAQAIHPGFGFLSERHDFAEKCERMGIQFIGPKSHHIKLMGDKVTARQTMIDAGMPVVPGSDGLVHSLKEAQAIAKKLSYPLMIKATAGGGGKGMRVCYEQDSLEEMFTQAHTEAKLAFGNGDVYIERFVENPRHIEVQVIGDQWNNVCHVFERECSVQRNNQKMIEEAPVQNLRPETKKKLYEVSVKAAKAIKYESCGTFEFIMDSSENFYFIEMNTRIQVEHPISEMISGLDLIKEQIKVAEGRRLSFQQEDIKAFGHAIELRINAEDPYHNFRPSSGQVRSVHMPGGNGVRIDTFIYSGYTVLPFYDSMIAKIIAHAPTRDEAMEKSIRCLEEIDIDGLKTNVEFQLEILLSEQFQDNRYTTALVTELLKEGVLDV